MKDTLRRLEGKYEIIKKIAEGGMGAVYKVRHRLLDEVRVIKVMRPQIEDQEQSKSRFLREARLAVKVHHENIAQMYDFSIDEDGTAYIVLEFIDGVTLQGVLKKAGPPTVALGLEIAQQSLKALGYLHGKGIVHRDISPDNLMLTTDENGEPLVKLIDLGIAKLAKGEGNLTATGVFIGKIRYASPEHFKAQEGVDVDHRSDIYSFGVVLYELLTGAHPIKGEGWSELIAGHLFQPPRSFAESDPQNRLPEPLRRIVLKAIAKKREDRYQDAAAFRNEIVAIQGDFTRFPDDLQYVLSLCDLAPPPESTARRGSTQQRLDQRFQPQPTRQGTPTPSFDPSGQQVEAQRAATAAAAEEAARRAARVDELLLAAARSVQQRRDTEARAAIDEVLSLDPSNEQALGLRRRMEEAQRRERALADEVSAVEGLVASGSLEQAEERLAAAARRLGDSSGLAALAERVRTLREKQQLERQVAALVAEAEALLRDGQHDAAIASLEQAARLETENRSVRTLLQQANQARKRAREEEEVGRAIAEAVAAVDRLLDEKRVDQAMARLEQAFGSFGLAPELVAANDRAHALQAQLRAAAVAALLAQAREAASSGEHERAIGKVKEALGIEPSNGPASALLAEVQKAQRLAQEEAARAAAAQREAAERAAAERAAAEREAAKRAAAEKAAAERDAAKRAAAEREAAKRAATEKAAAEREAAKRAGAEKAAAEREAAKRAAAEREAAKRAAAETATAEREATRRAAAEREAEKKAAAEREAVAREVARRTKVAADVTMAEGQIELPRAPAVLDGEGQADTTPIARPPRHARAAADTARIDISARAEAAGGRTVAEPIPVRPAPPERPTVAPQPSESRPAPSTSARPAAPARPGIGKWIGIAAAIVVVAVAAVLGLRGLGGGKSGRDGGVVPEAGVLVVNGLPWAEVVAVVDGNGQSQPLPTDRYTPLALSLPAGHYRISLRGPAAQAVEVEADVTAGETSRKVEQLAPVDAAQLLAAYGL